MLRTGTISLSVVFLLAFVRAPFEHVHSAHEHEHPDGGLFHSHLPHELLSHAAELHDDDPDLDAHSLDWFQPIASPAITFVAVMAPVAQLATHSASERRLEPAEACGHDPPERTRSSPRSPPV